MARRDLLHGRVFAPLCALIGALVVPATAAGRGPGGDYGDAPVGNTGDGVFAYPGVIARFPTARIHKNTVVTPQNPVGSWVYVGTNFHLGTVPPPPSADSAMNPASADNDCAPVILIDNLSSQANRAPLAEIEVAVTTTAAHDPGWVMHLNVWIDQNRDGQWKDGYNGVNPASPFSGWSQEWVAQDVRVILPADKTARISISNIRLLNPGAPVWVRVMLTQVPISQQYRGNAYTDEWWWDSTAGDAFVHGGAGEIEDHLLTFQSAAPTSATINPGIWVRSVYNSSPFVKPTCEAYYRGPYLMFLPWCPSFSTYTLKYSSIGRAGGCTGAQAVWGAYGPRYIGGMLSMPSLTLALPLPPGAAFGATTLGCAPPTGVVTLPPSLTYPFGLPLFLSLRLPVSSMVGPPGIRLEGCFPYNGWRWGVYRTYFHHFTCGSVHEGRTVRESPESGITMVHATPDDAGEQLDYVDMIGGGLDEEFVDNIAVPTRPFPDPDFTDFTFTLLPGPLPDASIDAGVFFSPPSSLRLSSAQYDVNPTFPKGTEAASVALRHLGPGTLTLTSTAGQMITQPLPFTAAFDPVVVPLPSGFRLLTISVLSDSITNIDELVCLLREVTPPDCPSGAEAFTFTGVQSDGALGHDFNDVNTFTVAGGYGLSAIRLSGRYTPNNIWASETRIRVTSPGGTNYDFRPFTVSGPTRVTTELLTMEALVGCPSMVEAGTWTVRVYESFDDGGLDGTWDNLCIALATPGPSEPTRWSADACGTDAGELPATAQSAFGTGDLDYTFGTIGSTADTDMYLIDICNPPSFSASTVGLATYDTQLMIFRLDGVGVMFNDDVTGASQSTLTNPGLVTVPGLYYLAISPYDRDPVDGGGFALWNDAPFTGVRAPDGLGQLNPVASWLGTVSGANVGPYGIALTGACFVPGSAGCNLADIAAIGGTAEDPGVPDDQLTVDDIIVFINLFSDGTGCPGVSPCSRADVCGIGGPPEAPDGQLTVDDIIAFFNAFSDGC